jgi:hypothetical protein
MVSGIDKISLDMLLEQFGMFMEYLIGCQELDGMLQEHQICC